MRPRSLSLLSGLILTVIACAHTSPVLETNGDSATGGEGGQLSGEAGSGGRFGSCPEMPCKLTVPQCGCSDGQQCSVDVTSLDPTYRVCVAAGIQGEGQKCVNGGACAAGLVCAEKTDTLSTCATFCSDDTDCQTPGGLCILTLGDGMGGSIPNVALCTENCDPIVSAECVSGLGCRVQTEPMDMMRTYTQCLLAGSGLQGSPCSDDTDCAKGQTCILDGASSHICAHYCRVGGGDCPAGLTCNALKANGKDVALGGTTYGACQ